MIKIVVTGHVDHGKSTILGRLLFELDALAKNKAQQIKDSCKQKGEVFKYAFLLDALKKERGEGITIDAARCFFSYEGKKYLFFDSPGHTEFMKNMVTGASQTDGAFIVIDALEGIRENSRRHSLLLSFFNLSKIAVLINKMDMAGYKEEVFQKLTAQYQTFARQFGLQVDAFIPISGSSGDNIKTGSLKMPWYKGKTLAALLKEFEKEKSLERAVFRMPVQAVYSFDHTKHIVAGNILSGKIAEKDELVFFPSGKKAKIASLEEFREKKKKAKQTALAPEAVGFTLSSAFFPQRGQIACRLKEKPPVKAVCFEVSLFWLSAEPLEKNKKYLMRIATAVRECKVVRITKVLNTSQMKKGQTVHVEQNNIATCVFLLKEPVFVDMQKELIQTRRFTLVSKGKLSGGGVIQKILQNP